ncbi:hypothetical protein L3X38_043420 [Prunus dulcis]|uniref:DUF4218 domain-containing protein n=1 Tax=Prunus dulcis TaxID=3755 RepID=A0AAD4YMG7_PRUDU|nr:hypothetical protein L3X38_043420 [Prunus dulcis]
MAKTFRKTDINPLRHNIVQVICKFEMIFPPAFFTSMIHVMVHLPEEALFAGPVNYCWMYPIEMLLGELKKSVRNRAKPEGSIIEKSKAVTTTQSLPPPAQTPAAIAPTQMDHLPVGPEVSHASASSVSSVAQHVSAMRSHRPASTTNTASTNATDASRSQPGTDFLQIQLFWTNIL